MTDKAVQSGVTDAMAALALYSYGAREEVIFPLGQGEEHLAAQHQHDPGDSDQMRYPAGSSEASGIETCRHECHDANEENCAEDPFVPALALPRSRSPFSCNIGVLANQEMVQSRAQQGDTHIK